MIGFLIETIALSVNKESMAMKSFYENFRFQIIYMEISELMIMLLMMMIMTVMMMMMMMITFLSRIGNSKKAKSIQIYCDNVEVIIG
jgi:hypothetical protein